MKALTAALALHTLFGLACLHGAIYREEWARSACAFLVASSGIYLALGMLRALRRAEAQFRRREKADERRRVFREAVKAQPQLRGSNRETGTNPPAGTQPRRFIL